MAYTHGNKFVVGGLHGSHHRCMTCCNYKDGLKQQTSVDPHAFEQSARQLRFTDDWWAMSVDLHAAERILIECRQGVIVIEKGRFAGCSSIAGSMCRILPDTTSGELVVRSQLKPRPYLLTDEARLSIPSHRDAPPTVAATEAITAPEPQRLCSRLIRSLIRRMN